MRVAAVSRYWRLPSCAAFVALAPLACGRADDPAYARGATVVVAYPGMAQDLWSLSASAHQLVFLPLATWDERWELEGRLARRWDHSPDYREWTYHLRTDVRWHDGVPVTAHDVKFTLDLLRHPDVLEISPRFIEQVTVHDDSTVTVRFGGNRGFFFETGQLYFPKHLLEGLDPKDYREWDFWARPLGNGPYRFVRHLPQTMMEFEANPDFYGEKPRIERVIIKLVTEEVGVTELLSGNVDVFPYTNPVWAPKLAGDPRFRTYHWVYVGVARAIYWRNDYPLFRDARVRRALTLAIDRRELLRVLNLPESLPLFDGPYTPRQFRRGDLPEALPHDPLAAAELLDAAGWRDVDGDGVREREGAKFRFTAIVPGFPGFQEMALYVQDQLRHVGVFMELRVLDEAVVAERVRTAAFEAAFGPFRNEPWALEWRFGEGGSVGYRNPELAELIERAGRTADPAIQDEIHREFMRIFRRDLPVTILHPVVRSFFVHRRMRGLEPPYRTDPLRFMEHLWVEEEP